MLVGVGTPSKKRTFINSAQRANGAKRSFFAIQATIPLGWALPPPRGLPGRAPRKKSEKENTRKKNGNKDSDSDKEDFDELVKHSEMDYNNEDFGCDLIANLMS